MDENSNIEINLIEKQNYIYLGQKIRKLFIIKLIKNKWKIKKYIQAMKAKKRDKSQ